MCGGPGWEGLLVSSASVEMSTALGIGAGTGFDLGDSLDLSGCRARLAIALREECNDDMNAGRLGKVGE